MYLSFRLSLGLAAGLSLAAGLFSPAPARAGVLGDTIQGTYYFPDLSTAYADLGTQTVSPTAAFFGDPRQYIISDTQLIVTFTVSAFNTSAPFNGVVFTNLTEAWGPVSVDGAATTLGGFGQDRVTVSGNLLEVNFANLPFNSGNQVVLNLNTGDTAVPEPASIVLLAGGLLAAAATRRRQRTA